MATIIEQTTLVRKAVAFVLEQIQENPKRPRYQCIDEAAMRFNLSPAESESLLRLLQEERPVTQK